MKFRRFILIGSSLLVVSLLVCWALTSYWRRSQPILKDVPKIIEAAQAFARDKTTRGQSLPASVTLSNLVSGDYLATNDVRAFEGMDVTIPLPSPSESYPQSILIQVRMPDGTKIVALADGSVQQVAR